jgi:hypothetical protein
MESKQSDLVMRYREYAEFQFATDGEGLGLRHARHALMMVAGSTLPSVMELDVLVIEAVESTDYINPALIQDDPTKPLIQWWWHLGKLRDGTYPAYLLPPHLRAIYEPDPERLAA